MSSLDHRETDDSAYPDPWASPGYVPDTSRGLPVELARAMGEWAQVKAATLEPGHIDRDWRALRAAEAQARDAGLRATVPEPGSQGSLQYQTDAAAWGTGRGIGLDGPGISAGLEAGA
jgi:hypothetical protein